MKWGRIIIAGIVVAILSAAYHWLTCGWLFSWIYTIKPTSIWKPIEQMPSFVVINLINILLDILLALFYALIYKALPGKNIFKGLWFGFFLWLISTLPNNFALGMVTIIAPVVIIYSIIKLLVLNLIQGIIIAAIYGE